MKVSYCLVLYIHFSIKLGSICTTPCKSDRLEYLLMMCTYMLTGKFCFLYNMIIWLDFTIPTAKQNFKTYWLFWLCVNK